MPVDLACLIDRFKNNATSAILKPKKQRKTCPLMLEGGVIDRFFPISPPTKAAQNKATSAIVN